MMLVLMVKMLKSSSCIISCGRPLQKFTSCSIFGFVSKKELLSTQIEGLGNRTDALTKTYRLLVAGNHVLWEQISHNTSLSNPT